MRAGYCEKTAQEQSSRLLQDVSVRLLNTTNCDIYLAKISAENLTKPNISDRISGLKADALVTKREVTKKVTTEKLVTERQIVEANAEVIAREKIYLKSLREPGAWLTVLHCKSVSYRVSSTAASR
ncbi:hypothetical protein NMD69_03770 [Edwardsiella tarda]|uniref:hypothetical protein n=1 Tax=Edwardsiella tarda TaxID=636 RepID=UPI00351CB0D3